MPNKSTYQPTKKTRNSVAGIGVLLPNDQRKRQCILAYISREYLFAWGWYAKYAHCPSALQSISGWCDVFAAKKKPVLVAIVFLFNTRYTRRWCHTHHFFSRETTTTITTRQESVATVEVCSNIYAYVCGVGTAPRQMRISHSLASPGQVYHQVAPAIQSNTR